ncbi:TspO/MBR family protein [Streptomyces sp. NPDC058623]|uniref:TspO/MBR family protein n=1 Tax=Streptomyces sp. NPDC058623 TaxID=3346563 RepID=UPI00365F6E0F
MAGSRGDVSRRRAGSGWWLVGFLVVTYAVAFVGALASADAGSVYRSLERPGWAPPAWLFGPVWTVLYAMIAIAAWLVVRSASSPSPRPNGARVRGGERHQGREGVRPALVWWSVQLLLNLLWTPLFFGAGRYGLALLDIVLLLAAIAVTVALFRRASRTAAFLLLPYLVWVAYAAALNAAIWRLNA